MHYNILKNMHYENLVINQGTRFVNEDVRWVITVPAIWKQSAKQFMREAAYQVCFIIYLFKINTKRKISLKSIGWYCIT